MYKIEHPTHALRCFASALLVFKSTQWSHMYDHVLSSLANQLIEANEPGLSAVLHGQLLARGGQNLRFQDEILYVASCSNTRRGNHTAYPNCTPCDRQASRSDALFM